MVVVYTTYTAVQCSKCYKYRLRCSSFVFACVNACDETSADIFTMTYLSTFLFSCQPMIDAFLFTLALFTDYFWRCNPRWDSFFLWPLKIANKQQLNRHNHFNFSNAPFQCWRSVDRKCLLEIFHAEERDEQHINAATCKS